MNQSADQILAEAGILCHIDMKSLWDIHGHGLDICVRARLHLRKGFCVGLSSVAMTLKYLEGDSQSA